MTFGKDSLVYIREMEPAVTGTVIMQPLQAK
jgi:hypothetical protein